jgi:hypothetical protein
MVRMPVFRNRQIERDSSACSPIPLHSAVSIDPGFSARLPPCPKPARGLHPACSDRWCCYCLSDCRMTLAPLPSITPPIPFPVGGPPSSPSMGIAPSGWLGTWLGMGHRPSAIGHRPWQCRDGRCPLDRAGPIPPTESSSDTPQSSDGQGWSCDGRYACVCACACACAGVRWRGGSAAQGRAGQCGTVRCVRYGAVRYGAVRYDTVRYCTVRFGGLPRPCSRTVMHS